jgi:GLPGLI family protein
MRRIILFSFVMLSLFSTEAQTKLSLKPSWLKWDSTYTFDRYNVSRVENYSKKGELMMTSDYKTYYQSKTPDGDFSIILAKQNSKDSWEVLSNKRHECFIECYRTDGVITNCSANGYTMPTESGLSTLKLEPTDETKQILGFNCKKYTYTFNKAIGEIWITNEVKLSNDLGAYRASHMDAGNNRLSVEGFVMEIISEVPKGGKTIVKTISLSNECNYSPDYRNVEMGYSTNKKSYYTVTLYLFGL